MIFEPVMRSAAMRGVDRALQLVAGKEVAVTLIGESGTGKEVLARRIHELSDRRRGPFVPINCAAIPEALFESELFSHERGAFTGANVRAKGKVEAASEGTLFLDEIGEMPLAMQAKLLRFRAARRRRPPDPRGRTSTHQRADDPATRRALQAAPRAVR